MTSDAETALRHRAFQLLQREPGKRPAVGELVEHLRDELESLSVSDEDCRRAFREARVLVSTAIDIVYDQPDLESRRSEAKDLLERLVPGFLPEDYDAALLRGVEDLWR